MCTKLRSLLLAFPLLASTSALADEHDSDRYPEGLPAALEVSDDEKLSFIVEAEGVQIYDCRLASGSWQWVFRAPEATLYSGGGVVGQHYAGPTWEANNGGTVVGAVAARYTADPDAIPWLRLTAVSHSGPGLFSKVTSIQRLYTVGGKAPVGGCSVSTAGAEADVPYEATYYFYKAHDAR